MERALGAQKTICLVAHDNKKEALSDWVAFNSDLLGMHHLVATGTTGTIIERRLGLPVRKLEADHGGDQRVGALIADGEIDFLVFFWDPLEPQPHDPDVKALLRIAVVWNIPIACNRASADFMISSPLMTSDYVREMPDYATHVDRFEERTSLSCEPGERSVDALGPELEDGSCGRRTLRIIANLQGRPR